MMSVKLKDKNLQLRKMLEAERKEKKVFSDALAEMKKGFGVKVKELSILSRIGDSISSSLDEETVCKSIINILISEMTAENCSVMLASDDGKTLRLKAVQGQTQPRPRYFSDDKVSTVIKVGDGIAGKAAKTGKTVLVKDTSKIRGFKKLSGGIETISSLLCIPIKGKDGLTGVINMSHPNVGEFTREDERLFNLIANQAASAFDNIKLFAKVKKMAQDLERLVMERTKELSDSEQKYKNLMKYGSDAIFIVSLETGKISNCNEKGGKLVGLLPKKLIGRHVKELFPKNRINSAKELLEMPEKRKKYLHGDAYVKSAKRKKEVPVSLSASVIKLHDGPVLYLTVRDITQRVILDQKLKNYSNKLEQDVQKRTRELKQAQDQFIQAAKLSALGELASGMAHEINNPVAIIRGYAEDLRDHLKNNKMPKRQVFNRSLDMIISSADRCYLMTDEILDFAKPKLNNFGSHTLKEIIDSSLDMVHAGLRNKRLKINLKGRPSKASIKTDKNHLKQVVINILNNAIDASAKGGKIEISVNRNKGRLLIRVTDNGDGIPREDLPRIFDPFFTTKKPGKGTGLGLSISYRIMEKLGGSISVNSKPGKTAFSIILPEKD